MINLSLARMGNPAKPNEPKKYYGRVQLNDSLTIYQFAEHVASHCSKYNRADILAVMTTTFECLKELVKDGKKVSLGEMGSFYPSVSSTGADTMDEFTADNIRSLSVNWDRPAEMDDMKAGVTFNKVLPRAAQALMWKSLAQGEVLDELKECVNAYQQNDSAVTPDEEPQPGEDNDGSGDTSGGSGEEDPNL